MVTERLGAEATTEALARELLVATNPDPDSSLDYLLRVPLGPGIVLRTSGTWPRTKALYCYRVPLDEWPEAPDIVERIPLRSCTRRGAAIDLIAARSRENRSQLVFTTARGREAVFWQAPRTRKQARPSVSVPTARAAGIVELEIIVDSHERYAYRFARRQVHTTKRALPCGDYGITVARALVAAVERKSLPDLVSSLTSGRLRYALGELATLPRAAVVVEDRYSEIFKLSRVRPALVNQVPHRGVYRSQAVVRRCGGEHAATRDEVQARHDGSRSGTGAPARKQAVGHEQAVQCPSDRLYFRRNREAADPGAGRKGELDLNHRRTSPASLARPAPLATRHLSGACGGGASCRAATP